MDHCVEILKLANISIFELNVEYLEVHVQASITSQKNSFVLYSNHKRDFFQDLILFTLP